MELCQGRLAVRQLNDDDGEVLFKWLNDPRVLAFYEGHDQPHDGVTLYHLVSTGEGVLGLRLA